MANLSIYDPFNTRINKLFNHFLLNGSPIFEEQDALQALNIKIDATEDEKNYLVHADLPGFKKDEVQVRVEGNKVTISGETKSKKEHKKGTKVICSERYEGRVFRSFTLENDIDETKADAKFNDGVLELTLPKKAGGKSAKQIAVK